EFRGSRKNPIVLVEIPAKDLDTMTAFYSSLLGWTFAGSGSRGDSAFAPGCGLARGVAIVAGPLAPRLQRTTDYVAVDSLAAAEARVRAAGGRVVVGADAQAGEGPSFIFEDPERNRMGVTERAP